jgi:LmbE family N-acetylglucosaminyl deacetylase
MRRRLVLKNKSTYMLAFSPHPIDTELGIGGTVARLTREGKEVVYVVCTNGDKGSSDPGLKAGKLAAIREQEQLAAAKILGVKEVIFLRHPDLGLEETPEFRKEILRLILEYRPEIVATCDPYHRVYISNRDHRLLGRVVLDDVWPSAQAPNVFPDLLEQGFQLHRVKEVWLWQSDQPNLFMDITATFDIKKEALKCHASQRNAPENPGFDDQVLERASAAAKGQNYKYGEAFLRMDILQRL